MTRSLHLLLALLGLTLFVGCPSGDDDDSASTDDDDATEDDDDPAPDDDDTALDDDDAAPDDDDTAPDDDCTEASRLIYLLGRDDEALYSFQPGDGALTLVGELDCAIWGTPASMGVTRDGLAYVRYSDNEVYEVDLFTADCTTTPYNDAGFGAFGMGYAATPTSTTLDTLFVANATTLATLSTSTWALSTVGALPSQSELTGNNLGELWAFLPLEDPAELVSLSPTNAQVLASVPLPSFPDPAGIDTFAFAYWGGSLWLFVREYGLGNSTDVYSVNPATGAMVMAYPDLGVDIVGAGVSTCAPVM
jgi:hypothetical protein